MADSFRFHDFRSHVKTQLDNKAARKSYAAVLDEWLSEAIKEENWPAAEAFMAGIILLDQRK